MADEELKKVEESLFEYEVVELPLKKEIWGYTADDYIQAFTLAITITTRRSTDRDGGTVRKKS